MVVTLTGCPSETAVGQAVHPQSLDLPVEKSRNPRNPGPGKIGRRFRGGVVADQHPCQGQLFRGNSTREKEERLPAEVDALDCHLHRRQGQANAPQLQTVEQPPLDRPGGDRERGVAGNRVHEPAGAVRRTGEPGRAQRTRTDESRRQNGDQAVCCRAFQNSNPTVK